jgi:hypothetical protein
MITKLIHKRQPPARILSKDSQSFLSGALTEKANLDLTLSTKDSINLATKLFQEISASTLS